MRIGSACTALVFLLSAVTAQAAVLTAGNGIYQVHVADADEGACGAWTARTGALHPAGAGHNVLFGGGNPGTSWTTLRSYFSGIDYATSSACETLCENATPLVEPLLSGATTVGYRMSWTVSDSDGKVDRLVLFVQEVRVEGPVNGTETVDSSVIRETHRVQNLGPGSFSFGLRKMWDWQIGSNDGPWFGDCDTPGAACAESVELTADGSLDGTYPQSYLIDPDPAVNSCGEGGCGGNPLYVVAGTVTPPSSLVPPPDAPELLQFNAWPTLAGTCWQPSTVDNAYCGGGDTATAYFWGLSNASAIVLAPTEERSFTQYVAAGENSCPDVIAEDTDPPVCSSAPNGSGTLGHGSATELHDGDTGIASVALGAGSANANLVVDPFTPGASSVTFHADVVNGSQTARAVIVVTDGVGQTCTITLDKLPAGPLDNRQLCLDTGIAFFASNPNATPAGPEACSSNEPHDGEPPYPPGYEPSPEDDPFPCTVLTIDSPISGPTFMVLKKDGAFDPRYRLLFSRFNGLIFPPFVDVTETIEAIVNITPDPIRLGGRTTWSPVKITCAILAELCDGLDNDGDGTIDEGLPVGGPPVDADGDGVPLCPATPGGAFDCNDQLPGVRPGGAEICNGLDDDCDKAIDEGFDADGDGFADCFDNCPAVPNPGQEDANTNGTGDICEVTYVSVSANHLLGPLNLQQQNVYRLPNAAGGPSTFAAFLGAALGLDAVDVDNPRYVYFSTSANGFTGNVYLQQNRVYRYDRQTGAIALAAQGAGLNPTNLDALDVTGSTLVFSTSSDFFLGNVYLRQQNAYRWNPATQQVSLVFDGVARGLRSLDALDAFSDGRVGFSTAANQLISTPQGQLYLDHRNVYVRNPANGSVTLFFNGAGRGLQSLDAVALGVAGE